MPQVDINHLIPKASSVFNRIIHFIGSPRILVSQQGPSPRTDRILGNIEWHDSDPDSGQNCHDSCNRPVCGGYNEAFIVQHWASYHLN